MVQILLTDNQRVKEDSSDDSLFYAQPRFTHHLDNGFRSRLTELYQKKLSPGSVVLDLMSSWVSHLPGNIKYQKVIGHGLNKAELENNKMLDSFWVQNLNNDQKLPLEDSSIDACLMVAAWQYLQYPEAIASELNRVIRKNGILIVSFSNRAFWSKTPLIWSESSDSERINYVRAVLASQGWSKFEIVAELGESRGLMSYFGQGSDPFFSIIATK